MDPNRRPRTFIYNTPVTQVRKHFVVRTMSGDREVTEAITRDYTGEEITRLTFADGGKAHYYSDAFVDVIADN